MPVKKKAPAKKSTVKKAVPKKAPAKKVTRPALPTGLPKPAPANVKTWKVYIESAAFFPENSADGYVDHFQSGRNTIVPDRMMAAPIILPVGAKLQSISIHYTNTTSSSKLAFFLRKHADRHSPSGEIEMSFIDLPNTSLPPDNYLTVTDTSFPNSGVIQDKFLHYIEVPTGDWGAGGRVTIRGVSLVYKF